MQKQHVKHVKCYCTSRVGGDDEQQMKTMSSLSRPGSLLFSSSVALNNRVLIHTDCGDNCPDVGATATVCSSNYFLISSPCCGFRSFTEMSEQLRTVLLLSDVDEWIGLGYSIFIKAEGSL